jgi:hypothetical protein
MARAATGGAEYRAGVGGCATPGTAEEWMEEQSIMLPWSPQGNEKGPAMEQGDGTAAG